MEQLYRKVMVNREVVPDGKCELTSESELVAVKQPTGKLQRLGDALMRQVIENRQRLKEKKEAQRKMWESMALD